ncbi:MAG: glycoside hydrolase [Neisseriales bacterium]|nr:MAG: glycoside hydrolase [Neisseriales bacterium]
MKITVLGGGGVRSPFLAKSILSGAHKIGITHVVFMDTNKEKLRTFGKIAQKIAELMNPSIKFEITSDPIAAITNADFVITTLRVGEDKSRVIDERVALDLGVLGQETTGAGGFAMAIRSVPALLEYCSLIKEYAKPNAPIFNFTNPSGIVTQALRDAGYSNVYGICDAPSGFSRQLQNLYGVSEDEISLRCYGLNHLSWFDQVKIKGHDISDNLLNDSRLYQQTEMKLFDPELTKLSGNLLLNEYLYFYYYREKALQSILNAKQTRGENVQAINDATLERLIDFDIDNKIDEAFYIFMDAYLTRENSYMTLEAQTERAITRKTPTLKEFIAEVDDGGYAGVALRFIRAVATGESTQMVLSIPNADAIDGLLTDDIIEISCIINKDGAHPIKIGTIPELQMNLIRTLKFYERSVVKAILNKDKNEAIRGLMVHPLVNSYSIAKQLVDNYLLAHEIEGWH